MKQQKPIIHGRDHLPGGADPVDFPTVDSTLGSLESVVLGDTPDGFWKLNESSGNTAADSSGNGRDMTVNTGASDTAPTWGAAAGPPGEQAAAFDSTHDGFGHSSFPTLSGDLTAEVWFKNEGAIAGGYGNLLSQGSPGGAATSGWAMLMNGTSVSPANRVSANVGPSGGLVGDSALTIGSWYHLVLRRASGVWRLFVNGTLQSASYSGSYTATTNVHMGAYGAYGGTLRGTASYAAVYAHALTDAEILQHYNAGTAGGSQPSGYVLTAQGDGTTVWAPATIEVSY